MMHYKNFLLRGIALLWLCSCTVVAQSAPSAAPNLFDLEFSGGTPAEFVTAVEEASGQPLNLIIPEAGREVRIPPFKVKQVSIDSLLPSLSHEGLARIRRGVDTYQYMSIGYHFIKRAGTNSEGENQVWVLKVESPEPEPPPTFSVEPVNVAQLLQHYTIDDLSTAIQLAWESWEPSQDEMLAPEIKFHKETSLLVVSGTAGHVQLMKHVLSELSREAAGAPGSAPGE